MKGIRLFFVFMGVFLLAAPAYAGSQKVIKDNEPFNLVGPDAFYDYRDHGGWSRFVGGSEARSGDTSFYPARLNWVDCSTIMIG